MRIHTITDQQWTRLEPLLPPQRPATGRPSRGHRLILDGILYRLRTGCAWRDLPDDFGPWPTVYSRLRRWERDGVWTRILQTLQRDADARGEVDWDLHCLDSTTIRAHQHAAGSAKGGPTPSAAAGAASVPNSTSVRTKPAS